MSAADALARAQALRQEGRFAEAIDVLRALASDTGLSIDNLYMCGKRLQDLGATVDASACFTRVLAAQPNNLGCLINASIAARSRGRADEALSLAERAVSLSPSLPVAEVARSEALLAAGRAELALQSCDAVLATAPHDAEALLSRGRILKSLGRKADALRSVEQAVASDPRLLRAQIARGYLANELGQVSEAVNAFRTALEIDPDREHILGMLGYSLLRNADWTDLDFSIAGVVAGLEDERLTALPFELAHLIDNPALMLRSARLYSAEIASRAPAPDTSSPAANSDTDKVRVAYLSPDFREHAVSYLAAGLLERHDRTKFEIIGVALTSLTGDAMQRRVAAACDRFIDISTMSEGAATELLRGLKIDIAVDLAGHTDGARPELLAARIAPVQVNFLGFPGTTGAPWCDYIIADGIVIPPGDEAHFSERIVRMPGCYQVNDASRPLDPPAPSRFDVGLPITGVVLACFNGAQKISPDVFSCWMRILRAVPGSVLWLLAGTDQTRSALRHAAAARGVDPARIVFAGAAPHGDHMARHRLVDLCLDTAPYGAHTAASDSLWSGVPIVALQGRSFAARVSSSILTAAGLPELITTSIGDYEALIVRLARDDSARSDITRKVKAARRTASLFDTDRYRLHLESAFARMVEMARHGQASAPPPLHGKTLDVASVINRGVAHLTAGRAADALVEFDRVAGERQFATEIAFNRGNALRDLGRLREAEAAFAAAMAAKPRYVDAALNRANVMLILGEAPVALALYCEALAWAPADLDLLVGKCAAMQQMGRAEESLVVLEQALAVAPNNAVVRNSRGNAFMALGRLAEAALDFKAATDARPDFAQAWSNLANALKGEDRHREAAEAYRRLVAIAPRHPHALGGLLLARLRTCDWTDFDALTARIEADVATGYPAAAPFTMTIVSHSAALQRRCAELANVDGPPARPIRRHADGRIRVAYMSADFRRHPVGSLMAGLFGRHDRDAFEIGVISTHRPTGDDIERRIAAAADWHLDASLMVDHDLIDALRQRDIEVLVDVTGPTHGGRPGVLAARSVPIQVSYLGFPGSTGASAVDYLISDRVIVPRGDEDYYSEKIVAMPACYQINDLRGVAVGPPPGRAETGLPDDGFVFCCFNSSHKIAPRMFDAWMRLLQRVPGSVLWLRQDSSEVVANLRGAAAARGVDPTRLIFAARATKAEHFARHGLAGIFLDTAPFGAHATGTDALYCGLPLIVLRGDTFASRVSSSLLAALGLNELVTSSLPEYEALAFRLATDPAALAAVREKLRRNRDTHPLFDTDAWRRAVERAYRIMVERARRGLPPDHIDVDG
ncbi:MAG: tetratricopeptide repeat protein [Alphaproteobacteria bacterium]|nr:tetratricopeptide repeat protein [Alphaproteobacteria bacterium]